MGANLRSRIDEEQAADDRGHTFVDDEVRYFVNADQAAAKGTGIKGYAGGTGKGPESSIRHSMKMMAFPLNFLLRSICDLLYKIERFRPRRAPKEPTSPVQRAARVPAATCRTGPLNDLSLSLSD